MAPSHSLTHSLPLLVALCTFVLAVSAQVLPYSTAPSVFYTFDTPAPASYLSLYPSSAYRWTETVGAHRGLAGFDGTTNSTSHLPTQFIDLSSLPDSTGSSIPQFGGASFSLELWLNLLSVTSTTTVLDLGAVAGQAVDNVVWTVNSAGNAVLTVLIGAQPGLNSSLTTAYCPSAQANCAYKFGPNAWQHVVLAFAQINASDTTSNTSCLYTVYINGQTAGSGYGYLPSNVQRSALFVNRKSAPLAGTTSSMQGQVDSLALWSYALDPLAAAVHYYLKPAARVRSRPLRQPSVGGWAARQLHQQPVRLYRTHLRHTALEHVVQHDVLHVHHRHAYNPPQCFPRSVRRPQRW